MKNMSTPLYQHVRSDSVPPRIKALAAGWQVWDFAQEGSGDTIHIDYDGDYGSERVLIVSGRATVIPDDGTPSFNVGPGDAVYFIYVWLLLHLAYSRVPPWSNDMATLVLMGKRSRTTR